MPSLELNECVRGISPILNGNTINKPASNLSKMNISCLPVFVLPMASDTEEGLDRKLKEYIRFLKANPDIKLSDLAFSVGKTDDLGPKFKHRITVIGHNVSEILEKLENSDFDRESLVESERQKLCFLFPGNGSAYYGMGRSLYNTSPVYRSTFDYIDLSLEEKDVIFGDDKEKIHQTKYSGTTLFHNGICLSKLWESWGVKPDCILPHSYGELTAGVCSGLVELDAMIAFLKLGQTIISPKIPHGMMICIIDNYEKTQGLIKAFLSLHNNDENLWVDIALINSSTQTVVGGSQESITLFSKFCEKNDVKFIRMPVNQAFHTRHLENVMDDLKILNSKIINKEPICEYFSSYTGRKLEKEDPELGEYWKNQPRSCCKFQDAAKLCYESGARIFLEIGAQPLVSGLVMQNVDEIENAEEITCLPSMRKNKEDWEVILESLARLWIQGYPVNWKGFYEPYEGSIIDLPTMEKLAPVLKPLQMNSDAFWTVLNNALDSQRQLEILEFYLQQIIKDVLKLSRTISIQSNDNLKDVGMDSLQAIQVKAKLQRLLGSKVNLSINDMFGCHTLGELTNRIHQVIYANSDSCKKLKIKNEMIQLCKEDGILWSHIKAEGPPVPLDQVKTILVTGATGNLAPYILEWLIKNRPQTKMVYCLIRNGKTPEETAEKRLIKHLTETNMLKRIDMSKITVVAGNVPDEFLGMDKTIYDKLSEEVDAVINCAVASNHLAQYKKEELKYSGVRAVNVIGTQRVLEFAAVKKTKWVYQGTTIMALWYGTLKADEEDVKQVPEAWPNVQNLTENIPNFGYGISKLIADDLAGQAVQRGLPVKAFMFPKINGDTLDGRQAVMKNHFFVKFLYYIIAGRMPDTEVPLLLVPVDTGADITLRVFFNPDAPSDMYIVMNPHHCFETELEELVEEFGPQLRILMEVASVVKNEGEEKAKEKWLQMIQKSTSLRNLSEHLNKKDVNWVDDPSKVFEDENVKSFLRQEFGYRMEFVEYDEFVRKLVQDGESSLLFNWIEFYTGEDSLFKLGADGNVPLQQNWQRDPESFIRGGKIEQLYPNLKDIIEHPLITLKRDVQFTITNAKDIFANQTD